jgi:peroxiredoxin/predicted 2-oxoglutarate/Fe(II)-dependent dioxygenase YbiX
LYTADSPIGAGDRAPDFTLPDRTGAMINLYTRVGGGTPLVIFYPDVASFSAEMAALREAMAQSAAGDMDLFAVVRAPAESLPETPEASGVTMFVVADAAGGTATAYGLDAGAGPLALRFDPNLRLTALRAAGAEAVTHYVERQLAQSVDASPPRMVSSLAPILIVPHVLSSDFCQELIDLHHSGGNESSTVTYNQDGKDVREVFADQKSRFDHVVNDKAISHRLTEAFGRRLNFELEKAFHYRVAAHDGFVIGRYEADSNGHFSLHRDNVSPTTAHFRFAVTVNLNFGDYEGGWLRFPEYSSDLYAPPTGGAIVFSCSNLHEATPVTAGTRYVLLTFLFGAAEAQQLRSAGS